MHYKILSRIVKAALLVVIVELFFWKATDYVIFNEYALDKNLDLLYYCSASIIGFLFSISLLAPFIQKGGFLSQLFVLMALIFITVSVLQSYAEYCSDYKNMEITYAIINWIIDVISILLLSKYVFKTFSLTDKAMLVALFLFLIVDMNYLMIGFNLFY